MAGAIISRPGEVAIIAVGYVSLFPASDANSYIVAAKLVVNGSYRGVYGGVYGGHTSCKRT